MTAHKRKNSVGGRMAWALVWFVIGAAAGLLLGKLGGPPEEKEPVVARQEAGDTVSAESGSTPAAGATGTAPEEGGTSAPEGEQQTGTTAGDTETSAEETGGEGPDKDTGEKAEEAPSRMTGIQRDRKSVKRRIYDYYAALSRDDFQGSTNCWHEATANTKANIRAAMQGFEQILVVNDSLKITDLKPEKATVNFTVHAYYENDAFDIYKKGAELKKQDGKWKIVETWNP
ncbi:MAG: hypothetical protein R6V10_08315 [bacterium]